MAVVRSSGGRAKASLIHGDLSVGTDVSLPGTRATPRRSAAWANPLESAWPGRRAQMVSPPHGGVHSQSGRAAVSAAAAAA